MFCICSYAKHMTVAAEDLEILMTIERRFDISLIASLALKEKQIQQNYRPIIAVHKWFARRPGTLFRGLLLSEFASDRRLDESYFNGQDFEGKVVADPFMGGGTPLVEATATSFRVPIRARSGIGCSPSNTSIRSGKPSTTAGSSRSPTRRI
jgi:hypothetical protein